MSIWTQPSPSDCERFLELVRNGTSPPTAARQLGFSGSSRFRSAGYRDPEFAAAYAEAKRERHRKICEGK